MSQIIIFGVPPEADLAAFQSLVGRQGIDLTVKPQPEVTGASETTAIGYLSYCACTKEIVLELFRSQPAGSVSASIGS
jgi:hypothetical protein